MQSPPESAGPFPIFIPRHSATALEHLASGSASIVAPVNADGDLLLRAWIGNDNPDEYLATRAAFDARRRECKA